MDKKTLERLEFKKVIELLTECATFSVGREYCSEIKPSTDFEEVLRSQKETSEASKIYRMEPDLPMGGMRDIRVLLRKIDIGAVLEPEELLDIAQTILAMRRIKRFFSDRSDKYPIFGGIVRELMVHKDVEDEINRVVQSDGNISDNASPELKKLRGKIRETEISIKSKMESVIRSAEYQKVFQEAIITVRGDRYVVPVKHEYKGQFPGIIHDQSSSGATLFIEPLSVVEPNNNLRKYHRDLEQEILRILTKVTLLVKAIIEDLASGIKILGTVDFILAKGKMAHRLNATEPVLNQKGHINLKKSRHPLIKGDVVPIDIYLGQDFHILIITGPNTGGKTVALKTVGLITAMAQSGLHIPCESGSSVAVFDNIFVDIGDEQSIEQSLSTFSGHLKNITYILDQVNNNSLVLLDELGAGTDPTEGAALATSVLEYLYRRKSRTIATTHYSELKVFAFEHEGIENASVEFDTRTLQPTYKLLIGQPGRSSAFEIALRLGLPESVVERARSLLTTEERQVADLVEELEANRKKAEEEGILAEKLRLEMEQSREEYKRKLEELEERKKGIIQQAKEEAASTVRQARKEADELVKELRKYVMEKKEEHLAHAENARSKLRGLEKNRAKDSMEGISPAGKIPEGLEKGEEIFLPRYNQTGYVVQSPDENGQLQVQAGILKLTVHVSEVRRKRGEGQSVTEKTGAGKIMVNKAKEAKTEIDIRGKTVDEALPELDKYLDDAYLAGLQQVQIIHGKGTGVLRKTVQNLLNKHQYVKEHRLGVYGEGGTGITVVKIK